MKHVSICASCRYAEWFRAPPGGSLHPSVDGICHWRREIPLPISASTKKITDPGQGALTITGGFISRKPDTYNKECPTYEPAEV